MTTRQAKATHHAKKHDPHPAPPLPPPSAAPEPTVDVLACFEHLLTALTHLARAQGSPPEVTHELDALHALLGKET